MLPVCSTCVHVWNFFGGEGRGGRGISHLFVLCGEEDASSIIISTAELRYIVKVSGHQPNYEIC